jgi:AcrR family transcriptional regulator
MPESVVPLRERRQQQTLLEISSAAVDLFAERGFSEVTVEEIARAAGVSLRTFHRYFPSKEHAVCPVLDAGWKAFMDAFAARPGDEPVLDGLVAALSGCMDGEIARRHMQFIQGLPGSPALEPVWLAVLDRCQSGLRPVLARRLGLAPDSPRARLTAACVLAAIRIAVETWASDSGQPIVSTARTCLTHIGGCLLQPANQAGTTT